MNTSSASALPLQSNFAALLTERQPAGPLAGGGRLRALAGRLLQSRSLSWVASGLAVLLTVLALTYVQTIVFDAQDYVEDLAALRHIKQLDAKLDVQVLLARNDLTTQHRQLDKAMQELHRLVDAIDADRATERYEAAEEMQQGRTALKRLVRGKAALVDEFKSSNLALHASLVGLSAASEELLEQIDPPGARASAGGRDAAAHVRMLTAATLLRSQGETLAAPVAITTALARLEHETRELAPAVRERARRFGQRIRTILRAQVTVTRLQAGIMDLTLTEQAEALNQLLTLEDHRADLQTHRLRGYLLLLSGTLTALLLSAAAHLLRIQREKVRINRELQQANEHLLLRVQQLRETRDELVTTARRAGMAEVATNVLHNVGNILNSVNVSAGLLGNMVRSSKAQGLSRAVELMLGRAADLGHFLTHDDKGKTLPGYLRHATQALAGEQRRMLAELEHLTLSIDHIKAVVATQQSYATGSAVVEPVQICELTEDALRINGDALARDGVNVVREYAAVPVARLDRTRLLQILVNLVGNARNAMEGAAEGPGRITMRVSVAPGPRLRVQVEDDGEGIHPENLTRIFAHGFTTRKAGHGFGLHSCALAAGQMGGTLTVHSDGPGKGATFTLELPIDGTQATP